MSAVLATLVALYLASSENTEVRRQAPSTREVPFGLVASMIG